MLFFSKKAQTLVSKTDFLCFLSLAGLVRIDVFYDKMLVGFFSWVNNKLYYSLTIEVKPMKPLPFDLAFLVL